jgi:LysM repeat protein
MRVSRPLGALLRVAVFVCVLASCARVPIRPTEEEPLAEREAYPEWEGPFTRKDIIHEVGPGETMWRISKMYDVSVDSIAKKNKIRDCGAIKLGQRLSIPDAAPARPVIPLFKNNAWEYIIIHHTVTDTGNALSINKIHLRRGFANGLGYHFIIDNGTSGKRDGQIEIAPRWLKQERGAHCKAAEMNSRGIGVGIIGNISEQYLTKKQFNALVYLVNLLREYYHIPLENVMGHGQVPGARTECPGTNFPWKKFKSALQGNN